MTKPTNNTREQVMAEIIATMDRAIRDGHDPMRVAEAAFPGVPDIVLLEALGDVEGQQTEAWWRSIERTIDSKTVREVIAEQAAVPVPAGDREAHLDEAFADRLRSELPF